MREKRFTLPAVQEAPPAAPSLEWASVKGAQIQQSHPPPAASVCQDRRGRLCIGYRVNGEQLRGTVEVACHTESMQVLTTLFWASGMDASCRRMLAAALRAAAHDRHPVRLHVFAAAARKLFRHTSQTWEARRKGRARQGACMYRVPDVLSGNFISAAGPMHDDLLAASRDLSSQIRLAPRLTIVEGAVADVSLQETLSTLRALFDSIGDYLERVLQPLAPYIGRHAIRTFFLETRREMDKMASCHAVGDAYVETLTVPEPDGKSLSVDVEGRFGAAVESGSGPGVA